MTRKILAVLLNAAIALVVLELCARVDDWVQYRAPLWSSYTVDRLYETADGVQRGKANARYENWQLNSLGLRGPELTAGSRRILCIGASETLGMLETPGMEYPRQLEHELRMLDSGTSIDVANLSYFGLTLVTADKLLPKLMEQVKPQYVVIYPTYGGYVARTSYDPVPSGPASAAPLLRLPEKVANLMKAHLPGALMNTLREREITKYMKGRAPIAAMPEDRSLYLKYDLANLIATIRKYGAQPVLVTHATRFDNNPDSQDQAYFLTSWRRFYPLFSENALLDMDRRLNETVRDFAVQNDILLVDAAATLPGGGQFFTDHEHFTDQGARKMAELIASALEPLIATRQKASPVNAESDRKEVGHVD